MENIVIIKLIIMTLSTLLNSSIRDLIKNKVSLEEIRKTCLYQYNKYKDLNFYITPIEDVKDGIPMSVKDVFLTKGILTTAASKILSNFIAPYSSTIVNRLENAGFANYGKTNLDEFAMGSSGISSYYGPTKSLWHSLKDRKIFSPGGSSSGAVMSVATGSVYVALATDTSGSIRLPASWSGVVGFKPTYGVFSRYGIIPLAESFDHPGLISRKVDDIRYVFEKIIGKDQNDLTSVDYKEKKSNKKKFGIIKEMYHTNSVIDESMKKVEDILIKNGYGKIETSIQEVNLCIPIYLILCRAECSSNLQRYDGIRYGLSEEANSLIDQYFNSRNEGFGVEVKRRIFTGAFVSSSENILEYVEKAKILRQYIKDKVKVFLEKVDFIIMPTAMGAMSIDECLDINLHDPIKMQKCDLFTVLGNITGFPAISVPFCYDENGSPVGIDILGQPMQDLQIMEYGEIIEKSFPQIHKDLMYKITKEK